MATVPQLAAWTPGYSPILQELLVGPGAFPEAAEKTGQSAMERTGGLYGGQQLILAMTLKGRFVDQEFCQVDRL